MTTEIKNFESFIFSCNHFGIEVNNYQLDLFKKYYEILLEWNKKINLISRKGEDTILERHFLDSIVFLPEMRAIACYGSTKVLDIGSGGGFPGIPLAIMKPEWHFVLCESINKKANFLNCTVKELELKNVEVLNARVEACHSKPQHKNKYDFITARAITKLDELIKYSLPLLKDSGYLLAYKAKNIDEEIKSANEIIEKKDLKLKIFEKEINFITRKLVIIQP